MCATSWRCLRRSCGILLVAMYANTHPSLGHSTPPTTLNHGSCEHGVLGCKAQKTPVHDKDERVFLTLHERIRGVYTVRDHAFDLTALDFICFHHGLLAGGNVLRNAVLLVGFIFDAEVIFH